MNKSFFAKSICILTGIISLLVVFFIFVYIFMKGKDVISFSFIFDKPSGVPIGTQGGIFPAIVGSIYFGIIIAIIGGFLGVVSAIFLSFYSDSRLTAFLNIAITTLSGLPSIIFGLVGYTFLIYKLKLPRSILSAGICNALLITPFISIRVKKIFDEKSEIYMINSIANGLSREYSIRKLIIPNSFFEILSAVALGMTYGMGAVAPILYTGAVMQASIPTKLSHPFMSLPYHLYMLVNNAFSFEYAYGSAFVLLFILLFIQLTINFIVFIKNNKENTDD